MERRGTFVLTVVLVQCLITPVVHAAVTTYTDISAYLSALAANGNSVFEEGFEDDTAWGNVRSPFPSLNTAPSVTSQGITWTSNHPQTNDITTGNGAAVTGNWGLYDPDHGYATGTQVECDIDNPASTCLFHDGVRGKRVAGDSTLYGIGGWFKGTAGANIVFIINQTNQVDLGKLGNPASQPQFFGIIDTDGFTEFEVRETDGKVGQELFIFADDFAIGTTTPTGCGSDPGNPSSRCNRGQPWMMLLLEDLTLF